MKKRITELDWKSEKILFGLNGFYEDPGFTNIIADKYFK